MVLFNQLTLRNILDLHGDLGTPGVLIAVASLEEQQKADTLLIFIMSLRRLLVCHLVKLSWLLSC